MLNIPFSLVTALESATLSNLADTEVFARGFPFESRNCTAKDPDASYASAILFSSLLKMVVLINTGVDMV